MRTKAKICGLTTSEMVTHAVTAGADYLGFALFDKSPRAIDPQSARKLAALVKAPTLSVALMVNPDDALVRAAANFADLLQLHGTESPARVAEIKEITGLPVMKAVSIAEQSDIAHARTFETCADLLLFDAKPPKSDADMVPGGNGLAFDWTLLQGEKWQVPWMLAGGLTPLNVAEAIRLTGAPIVDVSSGVERTRGEKDAGLIDAFLAAVKSANGVQ